jgi:hypothetical protein
MHLHPTERRKRQAHEYGPVSLYYADGPLWGSSDKQVVVERETFASNAEALKRLSALFGSSEIFNPFITDPTDETIWTEHELRSVCGSR